VHKLEKLAQECERRRYESTYKRDVKDRGDFLCKSNLYHLKGMETAEILKEEVNKTG